jgi:dihydroorotate dehydrogenase
MPLDDKLMPREKIPKCIHVDLFGSRVINAVGLSGPGLNYLLDQKKWQTRRTPFMISFMSVAISSEEKLQEIRGAVTLIMEHRNEFQADFAIQLNESCPNTGHASPKNVQEIQERLDVLKPLHDTGVGVVVKFGLDTTPEMAAIIGEHPNCDGICIPNTIPFGAEGFGIPWNKWYPKGSPLTQRGLDPQFKGGLSGEPLRQLSLKWVEEIRDLGYVKHLNAGGGLLHPQHVDDFYDAGADSISLGCVAMLRPWRVAKIIHHAHHVFGTH